MKFFTFKKRPIGSNLSVKYFVVLVVMMLMTTSNAFAEPVKEVIDGLCYQLDSESKTAALLPNTNPYSGDIVVPEKVKGSDGKGYTVTSFGDHCFENCESLTSISIPSTVTSLGEQCFWGCTGLTSVMIPSSVISLGDYCFMDCFGLTSISIPSSVTSLGINCFNSCIGLTSVTLSSSLTSLELGCFQGCESLTSITIPSSIKSLGKTCFSGCNSLTSIVLPSSVTTLGFGCFSMCSGLTSITIPSSVTSLGDMCFFLCSSLTSITIPSSVTSMGGKCFSLCSGLETIYFKGKLPVLTSSFSSYSDMGIPETCIIKVPAEYLEDYKKAFGEDYKYIYAWNPDEDPSGINLAKTRGIMASAHDGIVSISGLNDGEVVKFYAADGKLIGSSSAVAGVASCAVTGSFAIAKIGKNAIKIAVK